MPMGSEKRLVARACVVGALLGGMLFLVIWRVRPIPYSMQEKTIFTVPTLSPIVPMQGGGIAATDKPIRILFVGDMMFDRHVAEKTRAAGDSSYAFRRLPDGWFEKFDYAVANLEGPATGKRRPPEKSIDFAFDPSVAKTLKDIGIDAVSQANNHALDQGATGFEESLGVLRRAGLLVFGHQVRDDGIALATTTVRGLRLAFLGFNTTDNALDEKDAERVIADARAQADRVIVFMHWGSEYRDRPNASVIARARWFIDGDVDAVIGGHPHWVQGFESYRGKPIVFSLGNFVFDQYFSRETQEGLAVALTFGKEGIMKLELMPVRMEMSQPRLLEGEERQRWLRVYAHLSDKEFVGDIERGSVVFP